MGHNHSPKSTRKPTAKLSMGTATPPETPAASPMAQRNDDSARSDNAEWSHTDQPLHERHPLPNLPSSSTLPHPAVPSPIPTGVSAPPQRPFPQLSPESPPPELSEFDAADNESTESSSEDGSDSDLDSDLDSDTPSRPRHPGRARSSSGGSIPRHRDNLEIEELSNLDPMDSGREDALQPAAYEYAESERSRPVSQEGPAGSYRRDLDREFMEHMQNLTCSNDSDDELDADEAAIREFSRRQKELKRRNRILHGSSVSKRTVSERGGDSDHEDLKPFINGESPVTDRRTRRRVGDRKGSILHEHAHTPERIPELDEPETGDSDDSDDNFARELPYFDLEIMEVDNSD
jgi:hypothetical protein